jgi:hypothetical protein
MEVVQSFPHYNQHAREARCVMTLPEQQGCEGRARPEASAETPVARSLANEADFQDRLIGT